MPLIAFFMHFVLKYGGISLDNLVNEERVFNSNCQSQVLLSHIKKTTGHEFLTENIDLANEAGEVLDLASKGKEYAIKYLEPRSTLYLVKVVVDDEDGVISYVALQEEAAREKIKFASLDGF